MSMVLTVLAALSFQLPDSTAYANIPTDRNALLNGEGMGLASFAEMNSYPGPRHVIEFKEQLGLSSDQLNKAEQLMKGVERSAKLAGQDIVREEVELYKSFEGGKASEKSIRARLERIGRLRGELRFIHLQAHIKMKQVLSPNQIQRYNELRSHGGH